MENLKISQILIFQIAYIKSKSIYLHFDWLCKQCSWLQGQTWPWSYGGWIYNYLYSNQCLSPLMLWVWITMRARWTTLCDKVCQWLGTSRWFSPGPPVSSTNKTDCHDITEILLKVTLNTIKQTNKQNIRCEAFAWFAYIALRPWPNTNKAYKLIESLKGCW